MFPFQIMLILNYELCLDWNFSIKYAHISKHYPNIMICLKTFFIAIMGTLVWLLPLSYSYNHYHTKEWAFGCFCLNYSYKIIWIMLIAKILVIQQFLPKVSVISSVFSYTKRLLKDKGGIILFFTHFQQIPWKKTKSSMRQFIS